MEQEIRGGKLDKKWNNRGQKHRSKVNFSDQLTNKIDENLPQSSWISPELSGNTPLNQRGQLHTFQLNFIGEHGQHTVQLSSQVKSPTLHVHSPCLYLRGGGEGSQEVGQKWRTKGKKLGGGSREKSDDLEGQSYFGEVQDVINERNQGLSTGSGSVHIVLLNPGKPCVPQEGKHP